MSNPSDRDQKLLHALQTEVWGQAGDETDAEYAKDRAAYKKISSLFESLRQPGDMPVQVDRYKIDKLLGSGSFGAVYLAYDPELDREVAIKIPHPDRFVDEKDEARFVSEARATATLKNPAIVTVYDVGRDNGHCFLVLDYISGSSLEAALQVSTYAPDDAAKLVAKVAAALQFAHKKGFVHRDLKPGNILLDEEGEPHVADFGLAVSEESQRALAGQIAGTVAYMSPEQVRGDVHHLDGRSDIWALGVILYEMLTGRHPFWKGDEQECIDEIQHRDPKPPRQIDESIPAELERITLKCLAKESAQRYTTAKDLEEDLLNSAAGTSEQTIVSSGRSRGASIGLIIAAAMILIAGIWIWSGTKASFEVGISPQLSELLGIAYTEPLAGPPPTVDITAQFTRAGATTQWQSLTDGSTLSKADAYRLTIASEQDAFLYVWQVDSHGKLSWLYPKNDSCAFSRGANPIAARAAIRLPTSRDEGYQLDDAVGIEHLYVAASRSRWSDLESGLAAASGSQKAQAINKPFGFKTRGVAGIRKLPPDEENQPTPLTVTGRDGAVVQEIWFRHVEPGE